MDRREAIRIALSVGVFLAAGVGNTPAISQFVSSRTSARQAIRSLHLSILLSLATKNYEGARRQALKLAQYSQVDPNWYTYSESFQIAAILYKLTPEANEDDWLFAARGVLECFPAINGDVVENMRILARATEGLLLAAKAGKIPDLANKKSDMASLLTLFAAAAPGPERVRWAKLAVSELKANNASVVEQWGSDGGSLRLYATSLGLSGDWPGAVQLYQRMLAMPEASAPWKFIGKGATGGFLSFHTGRESFEAEVATALAMAGRVDEAVTLLEQSRRLTPSLLGRTIPSSQLVLSQEAQLVGAGSILVHATTTIIGALIIASKSARGKAVRTIHLEPDPGGYLLPTRTVNSGAYHFKRDGLISNYQRAKKKKGDKQQAKLIEYVGAASRDAHDFVGSSLGVALDKAKVPLEADIIILQPAAVAFLPIILASPIGGVPVGTERQLRFADSLSSASQARTTTALYKTTKPKVGVMALSATMGGPAFALFERASVGAIFRRTAGEVAAAPAGVEQSLQWPADCGYWHISSHAVWNADKPELSGIALGSKRVATFADIIALKPSKPPRLVFLSCCETALINTKEKLDRYLSLPTAFLSIGCGGVIASHWPVSDAASALLSTRFYEDHLVSKKTPAAALRTAQRWLAAGTVSQFIQYLNGFGTDDVEYRSQMGEISGFLLQMDPGVRPFADPYFWGGFQLYGT